MVSIIITTKNEKDVIKRLIDSIRNQSYQNLEIILVDNNSTDGTFQIAKKMGIKVYTFGPERSAQRNMGVKRSSGKYLMILDADMVLQKDVVAECVAECEKDSSIGGIVIPEQSIGENFWEKVKAFERSFYNIEGDITTDAARFFTREAFNKVEGYDESITGPEDWDFPENVRKNGFKLVRIKSKIYHYERIPSIRKLISKKYYYALKSHRYLGKNNISVFSPKTIYFLRPVFYRNFRILFSHPVLAIGMFFMLTLEQIAGGLGYIKGRLANEK
ncbi:glycosyltransferase [Candidatus Daviesbacteria bacterium]|nr:glycosyltransferase [Candidatus Daviesbacteria bacterium]